MKKIIGASVALLALSSCGAPTIEGPADALQQNQSALIENVEKLQKLTPIQSKSIGNIDFEISANEGIAKGTIGYDFQANQETYETAGNLTINMELEASDPMLSSMNMSGDLSLDLITLKNKVLFKLNSLNINSSEENPQLQLMSAMTAPFQNNWYFMNDIAENPMMAIQQELLTKQTEVVALIKKHTLLSHVTTNENADFYDYDVELNSESVVSFMQDLETLGQTEDNTWSVLTQVEIDNIIAGVLEFNSEIKGNIQIDKTNLEYFTLIFSHSDGSVIIENNKDHFNIIMNDIVEEITASILGTKSMGKFDANISVVWKPIKNITHDIETETTEVEHVGEIISLIDGTMSFETDGKKSDMKMNLLVKDEFTDEELKINFSLSDNTTEEKVQIEEPSEAQNFEEVIMQIMGDMMSTQPEIDANYYSEDDIHDDSVHLDMNNMDIYTENSNISIDG